MQSLCLLTGEEAVRVTQVLRVTKRGPDVLVVVVTRVSRNERVRLPDVRQEFAVSEEVANLGVGRVGLARVGLKCDLEEAFEFGLVTGEGDLRVRLVEDLVLVVVGAGSVRDAADRESRTSLRTRLEAGEDEGALREARVSLGRKVAPDGIHRVDLRLLETRRAVDRRRRSVARATQKRRQVGLAQRRVGDEAVHDLVDSVALLEDELTDRGVVGRVEETLRGAVIHYSVDAIGLCIQALPAIRKSSVCAKGAEPKGWNRLNKRFATHYCAAAPAMTPS